MRLIRLGAFVGWAAMASFAVAGFAAFAPTQPETAPIIVAETPADVSNDSVNPTAGMVSGRVAAMNFASSSVPTTTVATATPNLNQLITNQAATNVTTTTVYVPARSTTPAAPRDYSSTPATAEPWRSLVEAYFGPGEVNRALWVIHCESSGDPNAKHPSSSASGLFQHLPKFWEERSTKAGLAGANIFDPESNVAVAAWLVYQGGGWRHWNPSAHCWG